MKVGDYVRTDKGYITKISDFKEHYTKGKRLGFKGEVIENFLLLDDKQCEIIESIDYSIPPCYPSDEELEKIKSHIIKSSPNIIDLIEVGDYVNGCYVTNRQANHNEGITIIPKRIGIIKCNAYFNQGNYNDCEFKWVEEKDIKSILTKEQFESMEYKVGD